MRLWHQDLIAKLPRQQLLGQHRECVALWGRGWGKPHATVNYVFDHSPYKLYLYHVLIMDEMKSRGYQPDEAWYDPHHRGKTAQAYEQVDEVEVTNPIYPEHDEPYLWGCLDNLRKKGIELG